MRIILPFMNMIVENFTKPKNGCESARMDEEVLAKSREWGMGYYFTATYYLSVKWEEGGLKLQTLI